MCLSVPQDKLSVRRCRSNDDRRDSSAPDLYRSVSVILLYFASVVVRAWRQKICTSIPRLVVCMLHEYYAGVLSLLVPHFFSFFMDLFFFFSQNRKINSTINWKKKKGDGLKSSHIAACRFLVRFFFFNILITTLLTKRLNTILTTQYYIYAKQNKNKKKGGLLTKVCYNTYKGLHYLQFGFIYSFSLKTVIYYMPLTSLLVYS